MSGNINFTGILLWNYTPFISSQWTTNAIEPAITISNSNVYIMDAKLTACNVMATNVTAHTGMFSTLTTGTLNASNLNIYNEFLITSNMTQVSSEAFSITNSTESIPTITLYQNSTAALAEFYTGSNLVAQINNTGGIACLNVKASDLSASNVTTGYLYSSNTESLLLSSSNIVSSNVTSLTIAGTAASLSSLTLSTSSVNPDVYLMRSFNGNGVCQTIDATGSMSMTSNLFVGGALQITEGIYSLSDMRKKTAIKRLGSAAVERFDQLHGYSYLMGTNERRQVGLLAQELYQVLPDAVRVREDGFFEINYNAVIGLLVETVNELRAKVHEIRTLIS